MAENLVSGRMSESVVHSLEMVDIEHGEGQGIVFSFEHSLENGFQMGIEMPAIS